MQSFAFADYDNVRPIERELEDADTEANVLAISERIVEICRSTFPGVGEVAIRLYGGWTDKNGSATERAHRLYRVIPGVPRRIRGLRVSIEVPVSPIVLPHRLKGLQKDGGQKMVDTLISVDMTYCALQLECPLILLSDDEDMVPAALLSGHLLSGHRSRRPVCLSRDRACGLGANDLLLSGAGIQFEGGVRK